jgi:hypothetical protein
MPRYIHVNDDQVRENGLGERILRKGVIIGGTVGGVSKIGGVKGAVIGAGAGLAASHMIKKIQDRRAIRDGNVYDRDIEPNQLEAMRPGILKEFAIDLGTTPEPYKPCPMPVCDEAPKRYFPSLYIDNSGEDLKKIPNSGKAVITYKVKSRSSNWNGEKETHGMNIEIHSIAPKLKELEAVLDERLFDSAGARPRTPAGTFESQAQNGLPDPLSIKRAYQTGREDQSRGNLGRGIIAAGLVGAAGLAGHKLGKVAGVVDKKAYGQAMGRKGYKAAQNRATVEREGLGSMIKRQADEIGVRKSVESDHLKEIRDLMKRKK